uniref:F-box domain-containing protein n=1 Tax=Aplanochytrium stocchinoi TaxID=215587 RepID=A0A7S3LNJ0_9STRA
MEKFFLDLDRDEEGWVDLFLEWNPEKKEKVFRALMERSPDFTRLMMELTPAYSSPTSSEYDHRSCSPGFEIGNGNSCSNRTRGHTNSFHSSDHSYLNGKLNMKKKSPTSFKVGMLTSTSSSIEEENISRMYRNTYMKSNNVYDDHGIGNSKRIDFLKELDSNAVSKLMCFFDGSTIATCACVSLAWKDAAYNEDQDAIWQREFIRAWPSSTLNKNNVILRTLSYRKLWQTNLGSRRLWLSHANCERAAFKGHLDRVRHVRVRGKHFVSGSWDGTLRVGKCKNVGVGSEPGQDFKSSVFSGTEFAKETEEGSVHAGSVFGVYFDGLIAGTCSEDRTIKLWHVLEKRIVAELVGHQGPVYRLELIDPEKEILVSCSLDFIGVWHWPSATLLHKLTGHKHDVHRLKVSNDYIVTGSYDETIRVWEYPSCEFLWTSPPIHQGGVSCLHMCGIMVGSGSAKGEVHLWDLPSGKILFRNTKSHIGALITAVWVCANENKFVSSSITSFQAGGGIICVWTIDSGECMQRIEENAYVNAFCYEFGLLFTAYSDGVIRIRDLYDEKNKVVREESLIKGQLYDVDVQGSYVVACGMNQTFCLKIK